MTDGQPSHEHTPLRTEAERQLNSGEPPQTWVDWSSQALSHELQVYQVELELQNSELQQTVAELERERQQYRTLYEHAPAAYFSLDEGGDIVNVNLAGVRLLNFGRDHLIGRRFVQFIAPEQRAAFARLLGGLPQVEPSTPAPFTIQPRDGERLEVQLQGLRLPTPPSVALITLMDVTPLAQARRHLEQLNATLERRIEDSTRQLLDLNARFRHQALHDFLTGLPNRAAFTAELELALAGLRREGRGFAVLYCDIDRFKAINDGLGHSGGDQVLVELARRLQAATRPADHIARLGGDEFAMLLHDVADLHVVSGVIARLEAAARQPFVLDQQTLHLMISTGVLLVAGGYNQPEEVLRDVDLALYQAKQGGRAVSRVFQPSMRGAQRDRLNLEAQLRRALEREELVVHYQPIVALDGGRILGLEALVRWNHPQRGVLWPEHFIPLAEELELVGQIDGWVLREAGRQMAAWRVDRAAFRRLWMNVNVSVRSLAQVQQVVAPLLAQAVPEPWRVQVEITERVLTRRDETDPASLAALRDAQVELVVDDFGTGYSNLSSLHRFPVGMLKIDRSYVAELNQNLKLLRAIVLMGQALGLQVVAEGIETEAQRQRLLEVGVELGQGWLFAGALPADEIAAHLRPDQGR